VSGAGRAGAVIACARRLRPERIGNATRLDRRLTRPSADQHLAVQTRGYPQHFVCRRLFAVDRARHCLYVRLVTTTETPPFIRLRGRSIMALVLAPEPPLADWLVALDAQIDRAPSFFDGRPVVVDLGLLPREQPEVAAFIRLIEQRGIHIIGTEGPHPAWAGLESWGRPLPGAGKPGRPIEVPAEARAPAAAPPPAAVPTAASVEPATLLIDQPVRSGQSVVFERGDVTILGAVASGAEVMAGGSVHIYGALRGRAVAGLAGNSRARIFCRKLEAELIAIDGVYQTADDMPAALIGRPVQAWLDGEQMKMTALD
jgi:septum site-determining protein MinC